MLHTTLSLLKTANACAGRYRHLCEALGGVRAWGHDTPIPLLKILDTNGLDDALWALRAVPEHEKALRDRLAREFACDCAERVLPIFERQCPNDARPRTDIAVARRFAAGAATDAERAAAWAARAAAWDARAAARAARAAARDAGDAARAARAAARDARAAAWAAGDAAWDAETSWQATRFRELLTPEVTP